MSFFIIFFTFLKKFYKVLNIKYHFFTVAGWLFIFLFVSSIGSYTLFMNTDIKIFEYIGLTIFKIILFYILFLIPLSNNKFKKTLRIVSHKSYLYFLFFSGIILFGMCYNIIMYNNDLIEIFITNLINIMMTLYGLLTIIWFAYHIKYSNDLQRLRKQLQIYIFFITFLQLFFINKYSRFEYCISILILTYTYIQYLFEVISDKKQDNIA
jgi:hypothetical protein